MTTKKAIVMGATSGIGREVAILLASAGYEVAIAGRREQLLANLAEQTPGITTYKVIDINSDNAPQQLMQLINSLQGIDLYFHSSGIGYQNTMLEPEKELSTVATNALGFTKMIDTAFNYFATKGTGHIAAISSIAGTKGLGAAPAYSATKAFQNTYLEALAQLAAMRGLNIAVTDIRPGFVATDLLNDGASYPMLMNKTKVAKAAVKAVISKQAVATIDWRYCTLVALWRLIPRFIWTRLKIATHSK
ncbi:MAG: SDR family NAD(P)-dependent oxidoreductase [Muribaculaceae bacterium]